MEFKILQSVEVKYIKIDIPCRYDDEDIPYDFPLRRASIDKNMYHNPEYDRWIATIDLETGQILEWPKGKTGELYMKVCDEGHYYLIDNKNIIIASIIEDYVPTAIPGNYGDYVDLKIDEEGFITNWAVCPSLEEFNDYDNG